MIMTYLAVLLYPFVYKAKTARHRNNIWKGQVCWRFSYGYTIKECGLKFYRICPIRIEIIYGRGKFVGDFNMGNIICVKIVALGKIYADNVTHIKISNKLTPSINYFLNSHMFNGKLIFLISFYFNFFLNISETIIQVWSM